CLMIRMQPSVENIQAIADSDAVAVERTLAGDRDAFRALVERYSHNVFRLAYRMTRNRSDAEEIVQEAFLRAYQKLGKLEGRANFGTWFIALLRTTRLTACGNARKRKLAKLSQPFMTKQRKTIRCRWCMMLRRFRNAWRIISNCESRWRLLSPRSLI